MFKVQQQSILYRPSEDTQYSWSFKDVAIMIRWNYEAVFSVRSNCPGFLRVLTPLRDQSQKEIDKCSSISLLNIVQSIYRETLEELSRCQCWMLQPMLQQGKPHFVFEFEFRRHVRQYIRLKYTISCKSSYYDSYIILTSSTSIMNSYY